MSFLKSIVGYALLGAVGGFSACVIATEFEARAEENAAKAED